MSDKSKYYERMRCIDERFAREWANRKVHELPKCHCGEPAKWHSGDKFYCVKHEAEAML